MRLREPLTTASRYVADLPTAFKEVWRDGDSGKTLIIGSSVLALTSAIITAAGYKALMDSAVTKADLVLDWLVTGECTAFTLLLIVGTFASIKAGYDDQIREMRRE